MRILKTSHGDPLLGWTFETSAWNNAAVFGQIFIFVVQYANYHIHEQLHWAESCTSNL